MLRKKFLVKKNCEIWLLVYNLNLRLEFGNIVVYRLSIVYYLFLFFRFYKLRIFYIFRSLKKN